MFVLFGRSQLMLCMAFICAMVLPFSLVEAGSKAKYTMELDPSLIWDRVWADGSEYSEYGVGVSYHVQGFFVDTTGVYNIRSTQEFDGIIFLYVDDFDPEQPFQNYVDGNDDGDDLHYGAPSELSVTLEKDRTYYLITTSFFPGDGGGFVNVIKGPGSEIVLSNFQQQSSKENGSPFLCYSCATSSPCTPENIQKSLFYHPNCLGRSMFIQCDAWGQCFDMFCPGGLVWDAQANVCNWPQP